MAANGVVVVPLGDDLYVLGLGLPNCNSSDVTLCTTSEDCIAASGYWNVDACIGVVTSATGRIWMDRNLGASRVATSSTDAAAYGDLYQWGRKADGHQIRNSGTTSDTSDTDDPGHGSFIVSSSMPFDWRVPQNDILWQGVSGANNPCPPGFRLPTYTEFDAERASWSSQDSAGAFASPLKLILAGNRSSYPGAVNNAGTFGVYWSSTVNGIGVGSLFFYSDDAYMSNFTRASGHSVRCVKD